MYAIAHRVSGMLQNKKEFNNTYILEPGSDESIQSVIDRLNQGDVLQLRAGSYHQQIDVSGKKYIRIEAFPGDEGNVVINGLTNVDWLWEIDPASGLYVADYPGLPGLFHWQGDHEGEVYNNRLMYPVLATAGDEPLLWQPDGRAALAPGEFFIDSAPDLPGRIFMQLKDHQAIQSFQLSPFDRLLWGDEACEGISIVNINFKGCSNTGKTGAINTPGHRWFLHNVNVSLANTIGIELGQGGLHSNMKSQTKYSTFVNVHARQCGQMGWWGGADHGTFENCGHSGSNWKGFDHWWEASHKFESCSYCLIIRWSAEDCRGPGFWFDIDNEHNTLIAPRIERCVRTGIELELGASYNHIHNAVITDIRPEIIHPDKPWELASGVVIKANSHQNVINGARISGCKEAVRIDNEDARGMSDGNTFTNLTVDGTDRRVTVLGARLNNDVK